MGDLDVLDRAKFLRNTLATVGGVALALTPAGCAAAPSAVDTTDTAQRASAANRNRKVLLAYFSRPGENYHYGGRTDLKVGNTKVVAQMISRLIKCDVHEISAADPYSNDYEETVARNVREQQANARPRIANPLRSIDHYDVVLLASPIWNVRAPMIMSTFAESYDFSGKTVFPVTTYAMSGLGTTREDYAALCPGATIGRGLAVQGEKVHEAKPVVEAWLRRVRLLRD